MEEECEQKGWKEGRKEGHREGLREGHKKGLEAGITSMVSALKELQIDPEVILQKLQEKFQLKREDAERFL